MYNMQGIKHYITSRFPKLGFVKELQWVVSLMKSLQLIKSFTFLNENKSVKNKLPFEESLFTRRSYLQHPSRSHKTYLNEWGNPETSKIAELTIQLHLSNQ